jgi:hypothetical protein
VLNIRFVVFMEVRIILRTAGMAHHVVWLVIITTVEEHATSSCNSG